MIKNKKVLLSIYMTLGILGILIASVISIRVGAADISVEVIKDSFLNFDNENTYHLLIRDMRLPRIIVAALVGCALAVAGSLMQGVTNNPMADSGLMGINSGAVFFIALTYVVFTDFTYTETVFFAFLGSCLSAVIIYVITSLISRLGGNRILTMILSGAVISSFFSALSQGIALATGSSQNLSFWTMGSVANSGWSEVKIGLPIILISFLVAILISKDVTIMSMGDELATGLGSSANIIRFISTLLVVILASIATSMAGMISFVGLMIPHFARFILGPDYRYIIPISGIYGALLLVLADLFARVLNPPSEVPIGALITVLGVPLFLYLARKKGGVVFEK